MRHEKMKKDIANDDVEIVKLLHKELGIDLTSEQLRKLFDWLQEHNGDVSALQIFVEV